MLFLSPSTYINTHIYIYPHIIVADVGGGVIHSLSASRSATISAHSLLPLLVFLSRSLFLLGTILLCLFFVRWFWSASWLCLAVLSPFPCFFFFFFFFFFGFLSSLPSCCVFTFLVFFISYFLNKIKKRCHLCFSYIYIYNFFGLRDTPKYPRRLQNNSSHVDMTKVPGSFCCYSNHSPKLIQPRFDVQPLNLHMQTCGAWMEQAACLLQAVEQVFIAVINWCCGLLMFDLKFFFDRNTMENGENGYTNLFEMKMTVGCWITEAKTHVNPADPQSGASFALIMADNLGLENTKPRPAVLVKGKMHQGCFHSPCMQVLSVEAESLITEKPKPD
ncbi:hypothetical protein VP01_1249g1 [Puccinia sorghi]|uniref:Uncharacterized protein n=1 Tax=Puccinia sorghi TaxID=27349 RepID=A0A0L6VPQ9_9BASI|nr:hypothetical protein VP01_1249g1 [Puccinia sorghi]